MEEIGVILLMATRNPAKSPVEGTVVYPPLFTGLRPWRCLGKPHFIIFSPSMSQDFVGFQS